MTPNKALQTTAASLGIIRRLFRMITFLDCSAAVSELYRSAASA